MRITRGLTHSKPKGKLPEDSLRFYPLSLHTYSQVETWGETPLTPIPSSTIIA